MRPLWLVRGSFTEGERLDAFLARRGSAPAGVRGAALVGRAQLALARDPAGAQAAEPWRGLTSAGRRARTPGPRPRSTCSPRPRCTPGTPTRPRSTRTSALAVAREAGDRWNEGYALGTKAAVAALRGDLAEAQRLDGIRARDHARHRSAVGCGPGADRAWPTWPGCAVTRVAPSCATSRPWSSCARSTPGRRSRAASPGSAGSRWTGGMSTLRRLHLTESITVSRFIGSRIGVIRGLEAFATLAIR